MAHFAKVVDGIVSQVIVAEPEFFDTVRDAFYAPQPYSSWTLNETSCVWEAPVAYPDDGQGYIWNEDTQAWDALETP